MKAVPTPVDFAYNRALFNQMVKKNSMLRNVYVALLVSVALILAACSGGSDSTSASADVAKEAQDAGARLADVIGHARRDERRARDEWRHPLETLSFFGIRPDMTIVEVLPGNGGWYTQILTPLTAEQGRMILPFRIFFFFFALNNNLFFVLYSCGA